MNPNPKPKSPKKLIIALAVFSSVMFSGCSQFFEDTGGKVFDETEALYDVGVKGQKAAAALKSKVAKDDIDELEVLLRTAAQIGNRLDTGGINYLKHHLNRIGTFICDLELQGIKIEAVSTDTAGATAVMDCIYDPDVAAKARQTAADNAAALELKEETARKVARAKLKAETAASENAEAPKANAVTPVPDTNLSNPDG